jgi:hypothetical protein
VAFVRISISEVQAWLERTKLEISTTSPDDLVELELFHWNSVSGRLAQRFTVGSWLNAANTPSLVRQIVSMLVAASVYRRYYSEDGASANTWAMWLENQAKCLLDDLIGGVIVLPTEAGVESSQNSLSEIAFYPTDTSSAADNEPYFTMGRIF